jgi:hypothetical protein
MGWIKEKMSAATLRNYFFTPRTESLAALATRNFTTVHLYSDEPRRCSKYGSKAWTTPGTSPLAVSQSRSKST